MLHPLTLDSIHFYGTPTSASKFHFYCPQGVPPKWDDHPPYGKDDKEFAENLVEGIKILLMPATTTEEEEVLRYLEPPATSTEKEEVLHYLEPKEDKPPKKIIRTMINDVRNVYIGKYGKNPVIVVMTAPDKSKQGPIEAAIIATRILEKVKSIKYVVAVGVCFGIDKKKHKLGDVIVSSIVCNFTNKREGLKELDEYYQRGDQSHVGNIVNEFRPSKELKIPHEIKVDCGPVISTASLIDNPDIKKELLEGRKDAHAGEMEGAGIMAAVRYTPQRVEAIVIKGIGDWGDGNKEESKEQKPFAARAAAYYVKTVLDEKILQ